MDELDEAIAALNQADEKCAELEKRHQEERESFEARQRRERIKVFGDRKLERNLVAQLLQARGLVWFSIMRPETRGE